jgi:putative FmdB family regulatory protein
MPTYEYKCSACGFEFEKFESIKSKPSKKCPRCGKNRAKRLIGTGAGLIFKGSGFYITDYRSEAYKSDVKADTSGSAPAKESKETAVAASGAAADNKAKAAGDAKVAPAAKAESKPEKSTAPAPAKESKGGKREK